MPDSRGASAPEPVEIADRVWVLRHDWYDVNVVLVAGSAGVLVVDTNATPELGARALASATALGAGPVLAAVNTHVHFDHTFGNAAFREAGVAVVAHEAAAAALPAHAQAVRAAAAEDADPRAAALTTVAEAVPDRVFSSVLTLDLGDRQLELVHPGRGHTDGDVVLRVPDADVLLAGDLVEESGTPAFGEDCFPMDWPLTLDLVMNLIGPDTVVVPGHGSPVGLDFVAEQRAAIGVVAETIRDLAGRGVPIGQAAEAAEWPYPAERLGEAIWRGYEQLPRSQRRLPLL